MRAYFDYNASSPLRAEAEAAMARAIADGAGNPSSAHAEGRRARGIVEEAREQLAALLGVPARRVIFTSGATESNNTVLRGFHAQHPGGPIVTSTIEHHSVLATAAALEGLGAPVVRVPVDGNAQPALHIIASSTRDGPSLLSLGAANGETGHVLAFEPVREAASDDCLIHLDAAQAVGRLELPPAGAYDLLSLSAHKFGGPKGVGALVIPDDLRWRPLLTGGPQERAVRAGTENVPGIAGMGAAAQACRDAMSVERIRVAGLRDALWRRLSGDHETLARITPEGGLPSTLTLAVPGVASDVLVAGLDLAGFAVSSGSACAAGSPEPSHVAAALGIGADLAKSVVRISLGHLTTAAEIEALAAAFGEVVGRARRAA